MSPISGSGSQRVRRLGALLGSRQEVSRLIKNRGVLLITGPSEVVDHLCLFFGIVAWTTSRTSHENLSGNCFTNAVINVSAMT